MSEQKEYRETAGQEFARAVRPAGCVLLLLILGAVLYICFTSGKDPLPGYEAPQSTEYYAQHLEELQTELETNVFPELEGISGSTVEEGHLRIGIQNDSFAVSRAAILRYYDLSLFEFDRVESTEEQR